MKFLKILALILLSSNLKAQSTADFNKNYINTKMPFYSIISHPDNFIPKPQKIFKDTLAKEEKIETKSTKIQDTTQRKQMLPFNRYY